MYNVTLYNRPCCRLEDEYTGENQCTTFVEGKGKIIIYLKNKYLHCRQQ
jgi:hypothetical protein